MPDAPAKETYSGELGELFDTLPWLAYKIAGVEAWLWLVIPVLFFASYIFARFLVSLIYIIGDKLHMVEHRLMRRYVLSVSHPLALLLSGVTFNAAQGVLPIAPSTELKLSYFNSVIYTVAITWIIIVYLDNTLELVRKRLLAEGRYASSALIPLMRKISNTAICVLALLFLLQNIGFDVAALIAALGIGGIAVALASQKSVENLLGGIMISLDQPIRVGDIGRFGDRIGMVEDIGLRSTQIRTLERTLLSIPNADMAAMRVENITARDMIAFNHVIGLRYETTPEQMRNILDDVRKMLAKDPMVSDKQVRCFFMEYGAAALNLNVDIFIKTTAKDVFLETQEELLLKIREIMMAQGSDVNFPTPPVYIAHADMAEIPEKK
ncbi:MAG: mechanosensitive ion channel family protein [Pseudomonadota bacterium]